ncbi:MAG: ribosomal protein S18-alanine N-acetyltransferase [Pseudomonadota bacterium]
MTPQAMAALHIRCFPQNPWDAATFEGFQKNKNVLLLSDPQALALAVIQSVPPEGEILTLAVDPDQQQQGIGGRLLDTALVKSASKGLTQLHLEVAADNHAAIALYLSRGFSEIGRRASYYRRINTPPADALLMQWRANSA